MILDHLDLNKNDFNTSLRPVHFFRTPTKVFADLYVSSITEVNEKAQSFSTQVTLVIGCLNEFTRWNSKDFCGISSFSLPKDMFWTPDIGIIESIKTEFAIKESPYVQMVSLGIIVSSDTLAVTTACKMNLHRFPFDIQSCTLTLQSSIHFIHELIIEPYSNASSLTFNSQNAFQTQGEWELIDINMTKYNNSILWDTRAQLKYQVTIKRRPLLYVINFMLPVFYFLVLDVASFFINVEGGEKLSFKVTLLLAISVLLLILNDMLPSTAEDIPLIGIYCIVVFTLIGISILETIFVNFLMDRGAETKSVAPVETTAAVTGKDDSTRNLGIPLDTHVDRIEEQSCFLDLLKQTLTELRAACQELSRQNQQEKTSLCWTRVAKIIDVTFLVLYLICIVTFFIVLGITWFP
ncbi:5-hydroxytryptamine receptor 3A-like [Myxocyprinus asiaticus]|uniref:5-hydroxytryptamine receptor 3A-like n=1 Tax=Myxocyprinus asiaticus TaxID=70543 RepID=UPI0022231404|nr:5-hydroxytryptamine receptor 3A-like [Myxocyprinus asiaticus]XP_051570403.1 5-hydroxytryptamine receptor 3A-like [Myxocyprinus asiaticus]